MLASTIAVWTAVKLSFSNRRALQIRRQEWRRYYFKSINLALCYRGFIPDNNLGAARRAGRAAFYCCAYDVITDWRQFCASGRRWFQGLLKAELPADLNDLVFRLYEQERTSQLGQDGLSRGIEALKFVTGLIGSSQYIRRNLNFDELGITMQIIDDVLDLAEDKRMGEMNCLLSGRREKYLQMLLSFDTAQFKAILPSGTILIRVIHFAQKRALHILLTDCPTLQKFPSVKASPQNNIDNKERCEMASHAGG